MSRVAGGLVILLVTLGAVGCGSSSGAATPALASRLERVDAAAVADDPEVLASAVAGLLRAVEAAETAGDLGAADADEIRTAAEALLDAADAGSPAESSEPEESTTRPPPPPDEDDEESRPGKDHRHGKAKGHDKEHGPGRDKDD